MGKTFAEKILGATAGTIVFRKPDIVLSHDNTVSIRKTFEKMNGRKPANPNSLLIVLDHNAPPTSAKLANDYQSVRAFARENDIEKFYDAGRGICHQIMSYHARPGMIVVGSDSHTCTAGAFNALAAGIDRTETAGIWKSGETWFKVPESIKINLTGQLPEGVYAKDLSLWIIGMLGSAGANYMSIEYHGEGVRTLSIADRMTIANLASEMGAKNAVFPPDSILADFIGEKTVKDGIWADENAGYAKEIDIDLGEIMPLVAAPHHVDNIKAVTEVTGTPVQQGLVGTCTNGRIEDLRIAAAILKDKVVADDFQLLIIPASQEIYLQAVREGLIETFIRSGANVLSSSCGPCLGTGQGIPADGITVISTANRNFKGRMGNPNTSIYLASPATVAWSALNGIITNPSARTSTGTYPYKADQSSTLSISPSENRKSGNIWNYSDVDNLNTDQMFAGNLTYNILSTDAEAIAPHLFAGFDPNFAPRVSPGDIILAGENFGCGSSREHPAVGLAHAGVKAVIAKSVNRIFYRSAINQGLLLLVLPEVVEYWQPGMLISIDTDRGMVVVGDKSFSFAPLPGKLNDILNAKGLVNWMKMEAE
ncbi:MAG TPA: aconitase/3-isopropylmalate dehydratase large subunit family protein [Bacteroidales bacterium]|nr:aconitase/3-isopropylmalate dehydratase large subunit family protein [Bacteroidales bacterium]